MRLVSGQVSPNAFDGHSSKCPGTLLFFSSALSTAIERNPINKTPHWVLFLLLFLCLLPRELALLHVCKIIFVRTLIKAKRRATPKITTDPNLLQLFCPKSNTFAKFCNFSLVLWLILLKVRKLLLHEISYKLTQQIINDNYFSLSVVSLILNILAIQCLIFRLVRFVLLKTPFEYLHKNWYFRP